MKKTVGVRKIPMRKCTGCGEMKNKKEMIRVIKTPQEEIMLDTTGKKNGRGAYICNSIDCLNKAIRQKGLERSLKIEIPKNIYDSLLMQFTNTQNDPLKME